MTTNASSLASQDRTLADASNWGETWTVEDVEFVVEFTDDVKDEELALTLGRSLYAIWALQHRVRHEGFAGVVASVEASQIARARASRVEVGYTFIGDDVPPGWND